MASTLAIAGHHSFDSTIICHSSPPTASARIGQKAFKLTNEANLRPWASTESGQGTPLPWMSPQVLTSLLVRTLRCENLHGCS